MGTTYTISRTSCKIGELSKIHAKITFQDQLTTKDQSHSLPTAKSQLRNENSVTSPTSHTGCRRI